MQTAFVRKTNPTHKDPLWGGKGGDRKKESPSQEQRKKTMTIWKSVGARGDSGAGGRRKRKETASATVELNWVPIDKVERTAFG